MGNGMIRWELYRYPAFLLSHRPPFTDNSFHQGFLSFFGLRPPFVLHIHSFHSSLFQPKLGFLHSHYF